MFSVVCSPRQWDTLQIAKCFGFYSQVTFLLFQIKLTAQEEVALELRASQVVLMLVCLISHFWFSVKLILILNVTIFAGSSC